MRTVVTFSQDEPEVAIMVARAAAPPLVREMLMLGGVGSGAAFANYCGYSMSAFVSSSSTQRPYSRALDCRSGRTTKQSAALRRSLPPYFMRFGRQLPYYCTCLGQIMSGQPTMPMLWREAVDRALQYGHGMGQDADLSLERRKAEVGHWHRSKRTGDEAKKRKLQSGSAHEKKRALPGG
jgi:hypothetical protein